MSHDYEPPASVVTHFRPTPQLTQAVTTPGEIRFELQLPPGRDAESFAEGLFHTLEAGLPKRSGGLAPVSTDLDMQDSSKVLVSYKPVGFRDLDIDRQAIVGVFADMGVVVTSAVTEGMREAFAAFEQMLPQERGAIRNEALRRASKKPSGPAR
jgi:hypothetical protein